MRLKIHPALCEANGVCSRWAPSVYQLDPDGYLDLHLVEVPPGLERAALFGAAACPAHAITVLDDAALDRPVSQSVQLDLKQA